MSSKKKYISLIDTIMDGDYNNAQKIVNTIVEEKLEKRIAQASKTFLAKTQGK